MLQSTLDLLQLGYDVYVLADGVSSCNKEEVPFALARMRQAGAQITTSESLLFQLQRKFQRLGIFSFLSTFVFRGFLKPEFQGILVGDQSGKGDYTVCGPKAPDTSQCTLVENEFQLNETRRS